MLIQLTNQYGYPVYINKDHISMLEIHTFEDGGDMFVKVTLSCGKETIVRECLNDIKEMCDIPFNQEN